MDTQERIFPAQTEPCQGEPPVFSVCSCSLGRYSSATPSFAIRPPRTCSSHAAAHVSGECGACVPDPCTRMCDSRTGCSIKQHASLPLSFLLTELLLVMITDAQAAHRAEIPHTLCLLAPPDANMWQNDRAASQLGTSTGTLHPPPPDCPSSTCPPRRVCNPPPPSGAELSGTRALLLPSRNHTLTCPETSKCRESHSPGWL